jgi:cytochrome c oxidase cbb3-type subunit 3
MRSVIAIVLAGALVGGCQREQRRFSEIAPAGGQPRVLDLGAVGDGQRPPAWQVSPYESNAWATSEGKQLYVSFNCVGCHAHGGGGMGPPLMDDKWIYGGEPENVFASIVEGRPNGMPAFGGKLTVQQAWQLVAYVRALSGQLRMDIRPGRGDHMQVKPSEQRTKPETPVTIAPAPEQTR